MAMPPPTPKPNDGGPQLPRLSNALISLSAIGIVVATWFPTNAVIDNFGCWICGDRALADFLINIPFFIPLGVGLGLSRARFKHVMLAALLATAVVEAGQLFIPGRDASLTDVVANGLGGLIGVVMVRYWRAWVFPTPTLAKRLAIGILSFSAIVFTITVYLLAPHYELNSYMVQWNPRLLQSSPYPGLVIGAHLDDLDLPRGPLGRATSVERYLMNPFTLEVEFLKAERAEGLRPIFRIGSLGAQTLMIDSKGRWLEALFIAADDDALVFRRQSRAPFWTLDQPDLRVPNALGGFLAGDTVRVLIDYDGKEYCARIDDIEGCGLRHSVGRGWTLLLYPERLPALLQIFINTAWIAIFLAAYAFYAREPRYVIAGIAVVAAGFVTTLFVSSSVSIPLGDWVGVGIGASAGAGVSRFVRGRGI